jgi:hypothetical protein
MSGAATRYATLPAARARAVAALTLVVAAWLLSCALIAPPPPSEGVEAGPGRAGDVALYQAVVARVRAGARYHDAVGEGLRARNYPVRPSVNWRLPTYAWLLANLPSPLVGSALLALLGAGVVWLAGPWVAASDLASRAVATALMTVTMAGAFVADYVFLQEAWAGFLIALSVCLFARDRWRPAVAAGLAALAFRELALLPCGVALFLAVRRRRWPEVGAWLAGLAAWGAFMAWHVARVREHYRPGDLTRSWVALGGGAFLVDTSRWSTLLLALPRWAVALVLPLALLGLAGWRAQGAGRVALIVFGYLGVFTFVGLPFNDYWGAIFAPLLTFGLMAAPASLRDLAKALSPR